MIFRRTCFGRPRSTHAIVFGVVAVGVAMWPSTAQAHHPVVPAEMSAWYAIASALFSVALGLAAFSALAVIVWIGGPRRWRSAGVLRIAIIGLALTALSAACASSSQSLAERSGSETALFTDDGSDALADAVRDEGAQPGTGAGLPDLVGFTGSNHSTEEVEFAGQQMLVYNFDGIVGNAGGGPLDIFGNPQLSDADDPDSHEVYQREWTGTEWTNVAKLPIRFESADGHNHFHQMELARYTLHDPATLGVVAPSQKVGFCFLDSQPLGYWQLGKDIRGAAQLDDASPNPYAAFGRVDSYCRAGSPHAEALHMGISPGWGDLYAETLALQWVDISNVVPGNYILSSFMDPNDVIAETDDSNNGPVYSEDPMTVNGYRAAPVFASTSADQAVSFELATESFGVGMAEAEFTITGGPAHGTIDVALDQPGVGPTITYTPTSGFTGTDTVEFSASVGGFAYPLVPSRSVVTIGVDDPDEPLVVSGYRPEVTLGTGVELIAVTPDGPLGGDDVQWSVGDIVGGDGTVGTIVEGFYTPGTQTGPVTVIAQTSDGTRAEARFEVVEAPNHAPFIGAPVTYQGDGDIVSSDPQSPARALSTFKAGEPLAVLVPVVDIDGDPLSVSASALPDGLSIGASTGAITGTPSEKGTFTFEVTASDGRDDTQAMITLEID